MAPVKNCLKVEHSRSSPLGKEEHQNRYTRLTHLLFGCICANRHTPQIPLGKVY